MSLAALTPGQLKQRLNGLSSEDYDSECARFRIWLNAGIERGWVSEVACDTHDMLPATEEEMDRFEQGEDPCIPGIRVWFG
jgi:hypothetical protein